MTLLTAQRDLQVSPNRAGILSNSIGFYAASQTTVPPATPPTYGSVNYGNATSTATTDITKPTGTVSGSFLIAVLTSSTSATWSVQMPGATGATWLGPYGVSGGGAMFYKFANGTEDATYVFDSSSVGTHRGLVTRFEGVNTTTPVPSPATTGAVGAATGTNGASPAVTATVINSVMVCFSLNVGTNVTSITKPASMTQIFQTNTTAWKAGATETILATGTTGTRTWTNPSSTSYTSSIIINPA